MPSDLRPRSERGPARRTFLGAFDTSAAMALLKNLGGGVEAAPGLTWLVQFITLRVCTTTGRSLQTLRAGCSHLSADYSSLK